ncbi:hypothetical protein [Roseibium sp. RKSG952]|uniref:hypothetical protein n=1 Tax=Roseibium sp. RKSG952 TaxID=2529384 RepID=UPI0012BBD50D|nr:hypothetical protein [Roseibium sp. RKSG952]MTH96706.1 hypothetical protein [Roseibium sp. RKSG952]
MIEGYEGKVRSWLGDGFSIKSVDGAVLVASQPLGFSALAETGTSEEVAQAGAAALRAAGIDAPVSGFVVRDAGGVDMMFAALARTAASKMPLSPETIAKAMSAGEKRDNMRPGRKAVPQTTLTMIEACVTGAVGTEGAMLSGLRIPPHDLVSPTFFLPAILISAGNSWAMPVAASGGRGGFLTRLKKDPEAILGYRVTDIEAAAPLLLFVPIANALRNSFYHGECVLDPMVETFAWFLGANGLDEEEIDELDVRVSTS